MPNIRIKNSSPNINAKSTIPHIKVYSGGSVGVTQGSGGTQTFAGKGYMIGMMALTYITTQQSSGTVTITNVSDLKPNVFLKNTVAHTRILSGGSVTSTSAGTITGTPIGLLLLLTHSISSAATNSISDFKPNIRITKT